MLSNVLWFLIIGGVFYWMMRRGGCCGGHSHTGHDQAGQQHTHDHHECETREKKQTSRAAPLKVTKNSPESGTA
ncbi:hypothetical protein MNBD_DELTA04-681 [hydrothermal vent metagenome]|uniref:Uncharacterized protein n=1 Tax=hydrothermal vent metagenome TaxID=652676 RepID=A0A3B0V371_9ZZZZ